MKVPPETVGLFVAIAFFIDALTDVPMGWLSDRTRTRWGRRRPYIFLSAVPCGLSFFFLFTPPTNHADVHLLIFATVYYTAMTVYLVPYNGLGTELTLNHHERTSLMAYRQAFFIVGLVCGATAKLIAEWFSNERTGFAVTGALFGTVMVATMFLTFVGTFENPEFSQARARKTRVRFGDLMRNRPFLIILAVYVIYNIGILAPVIVGVQAAKHWLKAENVFPYVSAVLLVCGALAVPVWAWISRRLDKRPALIASFLITAAALVPVLLLTPKRVWPLFLLMGVFGFGFGGFMTLPLSIIGDTIDYDEYLTGRRREGFYWGLAEFCRKISQGFAFYLVGQTLGWLGYEEQAPEQSATALLGLRILFVGVPAVLFVLAALAFWRYPLNKARHDEMHHEMGRETGA